VVTPQEVVVRPTYAGEAPLVSSVLQEAAEWLRQRGDPLWSTDELAPSAICADVDGGRYVLALVSELAIGTARLTTEDPLFWPDAITGEAMYLHRLAVRRAHAGGATSRLIVDFGCAHAKNLGCAYLRLDCDASRASLRSLYEALGFTYQGERTVGSYTVARFQKSVGATG
jgi:GNAT superfamily N-acetyltransferase